MKKILILIPLIIILFSLAIAPMALADCECYCEKNGKFEYTGTVKTETKCSGDVNSLCGEVNYKCESIQETNKDTTGGTVTISDPLRIGDPSELYARIVSALLAFVGTASLVTFVYAGFLFLISSGNPERVKKAKDAMLYAVIGIVVSIASYAILSFIFTTLEGATGQ